MTALARIAPPASSASTIGDVLMVAASILLVVAEMGQNHQRRAADDVVQIFFEHDVAGHRRQSR